ncbi:MDR/zinc-dependent alcohol dehydrogenase-like family protein [Levilactobacillus enshiensis]|uniref:zinc-binding dehydrogenase n=1 Tax=Levilactobacillus enshiensis TaxID=2590213 RepID=UPI001179DD0C|nr:zinc-binding dehydrogenase [Levilactobacillus enshiensis]
MQAIVQDSYQGIDALKLVNQPTPHLSPLGVGIETRYTPVMPYDVLTETGQLHQLRPVRLPIVVGYGFGGIVRQVGRLRNARLRNQPVIGVHLQGSHQEQLVSTVPPLLFPVPENVSLAAATTLIGGADAAYFAVKKSHLQPGATILVTGASGGVGTYLIQLLRLFGQHVIAVGHSSRHDFLRELGADQVVAYDRPLTNQIAGFNAVTQIIDLAGSVTLLDQLTANLVSAPILSLALQRYSSPSKLPFAFASGAISPGDYRWLLAQLAQHTLKAMIQAQLPFTAVKTAQHHLLADHAAGRILLTYNQEV